MSKFNRLYNYVENYSSLFNGDVNRRICSKYSGNLFAYAIRKYIMDIFKKNKIKLKVSYNNSFIKGNPIEYDLLIVKKLKKSNLYEYEDVVCGIELKAGGHVGSQRNYDEIYDKFKHAKKLKKMLYISIYDQTRRIKELEQVYDSIFIWNRPGKYTKYKSYIGRKDEKEFRNYIQTNPDIEESFEKWILENVIK